MNKLLITLCCFSLAILGASARRTFLNSTHLNRQSGENVISSVRVTDKGVWSAFQSCDRDSFVVGFRQKVEPYQGNADNTALNAIELICNDEAPKRIRGATGMWGNWADEQMCKGKQAAVGFQLKQEESQGSGDDTAANALRLVCQDNSVVKVDNDGPFGEWSKTIKCPSNQVICGLRVQIEAPQGSGDDSALNNVDFQCCPFKKAMPIETVDIFSSEKALVQTISSTRVTNWGDWTPFKSCKPNHFVVGFRQKVEVTLAEDDNTALNAIELLCSDEEKLRTAKEGPLGEWSAESKCPGGMRANGFNLKQQRRIVGDNTAANGLRLTCVDNSVLEAENDGEFGEYMVQPKRCPTNTYICGFRAQIQKDQGPGDDTALNNVDFQCCS